MLDHESIVVTDQYSAHVGLYQREVQKKTVSFPSSSSPLQKTTELECQTSIVVVGPNGAGKSRLGAWLEMEGPQKGSVHRITAQRSIIFPDSISPVGMQQALDGFHWAPVPKNWDRDTYEKQKYSLRIQQRYGGVLSAAVTAPLNDIDKLMTLLFSENYSALLERENEELKTGGHARAKESLIRKVQRIWQRLLPHREIVISSGEIQAKPGGNVSKASYPAKAMSDGERVIFYLIGQCLCAKQNAIILIDEPEIHLHKAIQDSLWNALEEERQDCTFIYLTHDLTFAADRAGATKVCLTGYDDGKFSWFTIGPQNDIPEDIYLEVLGSRKPVLFVEGTAGSLDVELYQLAFPDFSINPVGGCAAVIAATKAFRSLYQLHHLNCYGLIDRDYLIDEQISAYSKQGIHTLKVAEVENLYLVPEIFMSVSNQLLLDGESAVYKAKNFVMESFKKDIHEHAMSVMNHQVILRLGRFNSQCKSANEYAAELELSLKAIQPIDFYNNAMNEAQRLIDSGDYIGVLEVYNKKGLAENISHIFEIRKGTYTEKVREMAKRGVGSIAAHLRVYLPALAI